MHLELVFRKLLRLGWESSSGTGSPRHPGRVGVACGRRQGRAPGTPCLINDQPHPFLQGCAIAKQLGAEIYLEGSAFTSEKSIHSIFRMASVVCLNKPSPAPPRSPVRSLSKRLLHLPSRSELISSAFKKEKTKSCSIM